MTIIAPPPPAPVGPPPLSPAGRRALRAAIVIAASALVIGVVVTLGVAAWGINALRVRVEGIDLPGGARSLTIDAGDATVRIRVDPQAATPRVELRGLTSSRDGGTRLVATSDASGTRLRLAPATTSFMNWGGAGEVTVTLPPRLARALAITTQQDDGTLIVEADLDQLTAHTTDGDIVLSGAARRIDITASDGDVVARKPLSVTESFRAEAVDGNVDVAFGEAAAPRRIEAVSRDGDIGVTLPPTGPYLVHAQSGDATRVRVPETTDAARAVSEVTVRSDDGNVVVDTADAARPWRR